MPLVHTLRAATPWPSSDRAAHETGKPLAPRRDVPYYCQRGHETMVALAADAEAPEARDCPRCGLPAGLDKYRPPAPVREVPYHTHLQYAKERRKPKEQRATLAEAMAARQQQREAELPPEPPEVLRASAPWPVQSEAAS